MADIGYDGKVAIITGAGGGLGRCHALELARRGARIVVNDLGGSVTGEGGDKGPADHVVVDIVINNAGILRDKTFHNLTPDLVNPVLDVHLRGAFYVTIPAWKVMRDKGYGRVINTSSNSGLLGNFGQANYGAAKMGLVGLTRVLANEGRKHNIRSNAIAPVAKTRMTEDLLGPLGDALDPALVTPLVCWLASEECDTTGEVFSAAGGIISRYFIGLTPGYFKSDLSVEDVRDNWDAIRDPEGYTIPEGPQDEIGKILGTLSGEA
jgi:NAD(P)-dependent dehydrogenase (short-subunit alcohol dehydrogenase family)